MRNKILFLVVLVLAVIFIKVRSINKNTSYFYNDPKTIHVKDTTTGVISQYDIEDYLIGVVAGEMPASFNEEALKAQAVAARTYAYFRINESNKDYDLTSDSSSQVYLSIEQMKEKWGDDYNKYYNKIKDAVYNTKDEILTYKDEIISAYYFAMSNGYTENSKYVFNESKDYLISVSSKEDETNKNYKVTKEISRTDFCNALNLDCSDIIITDVIKNNTNHISSLSVNYHNFTGVEFRKLLNLRSTDFVIDVQGENIYITTVGYGHGVGMSQYGANYMANSGKNYQEILRHYYTGTKINKITSINI